MKESEKFIYLDFARELKKLCNMKVTGISIIVRAHGIVPKNLEKRLKDLETRGSIEIIQSLSLLKSATII